MHVARLCREAVEVAAWELGFHGELGLVLGGMRLMWNLKGKNLDSETCLLADYKRKT